MLKKRLVAAGLLLCLILNNFVVFAQESKYPDFGYEFLGDDRWEGLNRKIFNFNLGLNKYAIRPLHVLWSSVMPVYGMERIQGITNNIEYPIRLVSSLVQRDFQTSRNETIRFFTNTVLGLGGMFDPAKHLFNIQQSSENMEQALAGCHMKTGKYFVCPVLSFTCFRGVIGKLLDTALNPGSYIATPVLAAIKAGLTVNKTSYMQPLIKMVESTYADPYDIAKKIYGIDSYIKCANLDRLNISDLLFVPVDKNDLAAAPGTVVEVKKSITEPVEDKKEDFVKIEVSSEILTPNLLYGGANIDDTISKSNTAENFKLSADMILPGFNPQTPVIDSMRTALFDLPRVDESVWNELSLWNRSFSRRIKISSVNIVEGRDNYKFRYILQKDKKNSPLAVIYPSIGEGIMSSHSVLLAKLFYDEGYSVIIQGSHFQWEFVKSMEEGYTPGLPSKDAENLRVVTSKIIDSLHDKYGCEFGEKVFIGTSFGALTSLFLADKEYKNNQLGNTRYISICPPVELIYAMKQIDKNTQEWNNSSDDLKQRVASTAAKVLKLYETKDSLNNNTEINFLPFSDDEAKLITGFIMHQKLSDLIFTLENGSKSAKSDIYHTLNNMNYEDYAQKYLLKDSEYSIDSLAYEVSLHSISDYLENASNYKIYHSLTDYLTNANQLKKLKQYSKDKVVLIDNGAHLGFLYRQEFIDDLKETISLKNSKIIAGK
ncbi:MAG: MlaA family lipoprotein [Muribaculaceae bacterium]|nr:MlaA family lipoprotein [Muribaculaceae bacterium]